MKQAITDPNTLKQLTQTLNQHFHQEIPEQDEQQMEDQYHTAQTSDEDSSYYDETDNDTILEAPSLMEQSAYDDSASIAKKLKRKFSKKYTEQLDSIQILRKLSTKLQRKRSKISEKAKQKEILRKNSKTKNKLTRRMTIEKEFVNEHRIDKLTLGEDPEVKIVPR